MTRPLSLLILAGMMFAMSCSRIHAKGPAVNISTAMAIGVQEIEFSESNPNTYIIFDNPKAGDYMSIVFSTDGKGAELTWSNEDGSKQKKHIDPSYFCKACPRCPS